MSGKNNHFCTKNSPSPCGNGEQKLILFLYLLDGAHSVSYTHLLHKIDRPAARIKEVIDEVLYLLMDLGATDEQLDCPMLFCCGRDGTASLDPDVPGTDLIPLFDTLLSTIKPPEGDPEAPVQLSLIHI